MEHSLQTKTPLVARTVNGIPVLTVDAQHPIGDGVCRISHADAFFATRLPRDIWNALLDAPSELNMYLSAILELMLYTGKGFVETMELTRVELPVSKAWHVFQPDPGDQSSLERFYSETDAFVFDGIANHASPPTMATLGEIVRICLHFGLLNVLDWGAGVGTLTILLNKYGIKAHHVDLPGKTLEFARWRYALRSMDVSVTSLPFQFEKESVDGIVCLEVVEHVKDPLEMLKDLHRIIKPNGILICSESCAQLQYASHLRANASLSAAALIKEMRSIGFELISEFSRMHPKTFRRI